MKEPSQYEKFHWAVVNAGARLFAYGLVFVCALFILLVVATMFGKPLGAEFPTWNLLLFVPLLIVGALMIKAKPYYPAEYKEWYESK
jgi:low temperature requirement protein LtrA